MCFRTTLFRAACVSLGFVSFAGGQDTQHEIVLQTGHAVGVKAVAFHPDGKRVATGGDDDCVILWDVTTGRQLRTYRGGPLGNGYEVKAGLMDMKLPEEFPLAATASCSVERTQFSRDGSRLLVHCAPRGIGDLLLACCVATIWNTADGRLIRRIELGQEIDTLALSPDGRLLFGAGWSMSPEEAQEIAAAGVKIAPDAPATIWDVESGRKVKQFHSQQLEMTSGQFTADGRSVITVCCERRGTNRMQRGPSAPSQSTETPPTAPASPDSSSSLREAQPASLVIWDVSTAKAVRQFPLTQGMTDLAVAPRGDRMLLWNSQRRELPMEVWDLRTAKRLYSVQGTLPAFGKDGEQWTVIDAEGCARTYRMSDGKEVGKFSGELQGATALAISGDGTKLVVGMMYQLDSSLPDGAKPRRSPGEALVFNRGQGTILARLACRQDPIDALAVSPSGRYLAIGSTLWDTQQGAPVAALCGKPVQQFAAAFAPDERRIAVSNHQPAPMFDFLSAVGLGEKPSTVLARELELPLCREIREFSVAERVYDRVVLAYDAAGKRIMTITASGTVALWDAREGNRIAQSAIQGNRMGFAPSPSGKVVAAFYESEHAIWWDLQSGKEVSAAGRKAADVRPDGSPINVSSDGQRTLEVNDDATAVTLIDSSKPGTRLTLQPKLEKGTVLGKVGFDVENQRFAFTKTHTLRNVLLDSETGKTIRELETVEMQLTIAVFAPDEQHVVASGEEGRIVIWSVGDGRIVEQLSCPSPVTALGYRADGKCLAAGCADRRVVITQLDNKATTVLRGHEGTVDGVAFTAQGKLLVTVSAQDATARLWNAASGQELGRVINLNDRADWVVVTPDGFYDGSPAGRQAVMYRTGGQDLATTESVKPSRYRPGLLARLWRGEPVR